MCTTNHIVHFTLSIIMIPFIHVQVYFVSNNSHFVWYSIAIVVRLFMLGDSLLLQLGTSIHMMRSFVQHKELYVNYTRKNNLRLPLPIITTKM